MATATQVQQTYLAYFGRPADPAGLQYWMGLDVATMQQGFAGSAEYANLYAGMSVDQRVDQVYANLLGRASDAAGKAYWVAHMKSGAVTVSDLVVAVQAGAQSTDIDTITNRITYSTLFTAALDTPAEVAGYSGYAACAAARAVVSAVTCSAASLATAESTLNADIVSVSTGVAPATTTGGGSATAATFTVTNSCAVNTTAKTATIDFTNTVINNTSDEAALKIAITVSTDGTTFSALASSDSVSIVDGNVVVLFATLPTSNTLKFQVAASALKDDVGAINTAVVTTAAIDNMAPAAPTISHLVGATNFDAGFRVTEGAAVTLTNATADNFTKSTASGLDTYTAKVDAFAGSETIKVDATLTDAAGNRSAAATQLTLAAIDTTAPSAPTVSRLVIVTGFDAGFTVTEGAKVTLTGTALTNFTKSTAPGLDTYTAKVNAFAGSETITVDATLTDAAGNTSAATQLPLAAIDTTGPTATVSTTTTQPVGHAVVQSSETGTAYLVNDSVTVSNLASITSAVDNTFNAISITAATPTDLVATGLIDGSYYVYTVDAVGNLSTGSTNSVTVDGTAPTITAGPTASGATISLTVNEASTAGLYNTVNSALLGSSTTMVANEANTITVDAQSPVTSTKLVVQDAAGNRTNSVNVILGTIGADSISSTDGKNFIFGFGGADSLDGYRGENTFVYVSVADSAASIATNAIRTFDAIVDFSYNSANRINLAAINTALTDGVAATGITVAPVSGIALATYASDATTSFAQLAAAINSAGGLEPSRAGAATGDTGLQACVIDLSNNTGALGGAKYLVINNNDTVLGAGDVMIELSGLNTTVAASAFIL